MGLWDLLEEKPEKEEQKDEPKKADKKAAQKKESKKKESKKTVDKKDTTSAKTYKYPFGMYTEGHQVDISNYGFEEDKEYDADQITKIMLQHKHYEFSGQMEYNMIEEDNILVANAKQHKKG